MGLLLAIRRRFEDTLFCLQKKDKSVQFRKVKPWKSTQQWNDRGKSEETIKSSMKDSEQKMQLNVDREVLEKSF